MIIGIGIDVVDIDRFHAIAARTPGFAERVLTHAERHHRDGTPRARASLAARWAAKEAVAKALGAPAGMHWHDCEVSVDEAGKPHLRLTGSVLSAAEQLGITHWHVSLSHDGGLAMAQVIAERRT